MYIQYDVFQFNNTDINFYHCGEEKCISKHSYGPAVRDHYLIHYILDGEGLYKVGNKTYHLKKGQGFLIWPNVITHYQADKNNPWHYVWVGFHGVKAKEYLECANLNSEKLIFTYDKDDYIEKYIRQMIEANQLTKGKDLNLLGYLHLFLGKLIENNSDSIEENIKNEKHDYVKEAVNYIHVNYWRNITIHDISKYVSLNRSYLYTLFKEQLSISPQQYLIQFRMKKACELMKNTSLTISQIARSIGYEDPLMFSRTFKKNKGVAPKYYRMNE